MERKGFLKLLGLVPLAAIPAAKKEEGNPLDVVLSVHDEKWSEVSLVEFRDGSRIFWWENDWRVAMPDGSVMPPKGFENVRWSESIGQVEPRFHITWHAHFSEGNSWPHGKIEALGRKLGVGVPSGIDI